MIVDRNTKRIGANKVDQAFTAEACYELTEPTIAKGWATPSVYTVERLK
jgi:hypothetical protein